MTPSHSRRARAPAGSRRRPVGESGAAIVEFVFAGVLLLAPLLYVVLALSEAQRHAFAVTQAAREAGRAYATADDPSTASARATYAVRLALADQGLSGDAELHWGPIGASCEGPLVADGLTVDSTVSPVSEAPPLTAGSRYELCVRTTYRLPGVPTLLDAGRNTVEARYVVRLDDLRGER
ncbi:TadE/TadG family type IV pilus assembly protein [Cryptosporangium aurantiacum]|uniref:TadE-like protein n=1 Tax=Cryptosporangium aurantiacum TaxID=134849 RepID=A0A1M7RNK2_9ACTN|nr:hypothetical protein [Cryptosporangium aurantiacum]SHN47791.1 hypothetical protein SAMN05443668_12821 [Cryptosporangium aurantiacum]